MANVDFVLTENILVVLGIWVLVYVLDYYLTVLGAKLHAQGANEHILYEGSYEITPVFQEDIDALRLFSPRFLLHVVVSCAVILVSIQKFSRGGSHATEIPGVGAWSANLRIGS